ncbi:hypothetical protein [Frankia canadensis]|uniref:hypothetical protein n=1 Tax=Frankia canadensis TaxID=1836972 RepID=UPI000C7C6E01|nr:hypothetical protein [Frankia canadensis]
MRTDDPDDLPPLLAHAEVIELTPEIELAIAEGERSIAEGTLLRFHSEEEFQAFLDGLSRQI